MTRSQFEDRLGRVPSPEDLRDRRFSMAAFMEPPPNLPTSKYWTPGRILDQGQTPNCVGFAWAQWMQTSPTRPLPRNKFNGDAKGHAIYARCKAIDGYDGDGTYIRAGAKIMQDEGRLNNYVWAYSLDHLIEWVLLKGPVVVGTWWHEDMFDPDADGTLHVSGPLVGGHAYMIRGYGRTRDQFRVVNSWGKGWGQNGQAWISATDMWNLIDHDGEACAAIELVP